MKTEFRRRLQVLINSESMENDSNTPDFLLAEFLSDVLEAWNRTVQAREKWYGREPRAVPSYCEPKTSVSSPVPTQDYAAPPTEPADIPFDGCNPGERGAPEIEPAPVAASAGAPSVLPLQEGWSKCVKCGAEFQGTGKYCIDCQF